MAATTYPKNLGVNVVDTGAKLVKKGEANTDVSVYQDILQSYMGGIDQGVAENIAGSAKKTGLNSAVNDPYIQEIERRAAEERQKQAAAAAAAAKPAAKANTVQPVQTTARPTVQSATPAPVIKGKKASTPQMVALEGNPYAPGEVALERQRMAMRESQQNPANYLLTEADLAKTRTPVQTVQTEKPAMQGAKFGTNTGEVALEDNTEKSVKTIAETNIPAREARSAYVKVPEEITPENVSLSSYNKALSGADTARIKYDQTMKREYQVEDRLLDIEAQMNIALQQYKNGDLSALAKYEQYLAQYQNLLAQYNVAVNDRAKVTSAYLKAIDTKNASEQAYYLTAAYGDNLKRQIDQLENEYYNTHPQEQTHFSETSGYGIDIKYLADDELGRQIKDLRDQYETWELARNRYIYSVDSAENEALREQNRQNLAAALARTDSIEDIDARIKALDDERAELRKQVSDVVTGQISMTDAAYNDILARIEQIGDQLNLARADRAFVLNSLSLINEPQRVAEAQEKVETLEAEIKRLEWMDRYLIAQMGVSSLSEVLELTGDRNRVFQEKAAKEKELNEYKAFLYSYDMNLVLDNLPEEDHLLFDAVAKGGSTAKSAEQKLKAKYGGRYEQYLDYAERDYNAMMMRRTQAEISKEIKDNGWNKITYSALSVATNLLSSPGALYEIIKQTATKEAYEPYDVNASGFQMQNLTKTIRSSVSEDMGAAGSFFYQTAMSGIDSMVSMYVFKPVAEAANLISAGAGANIISHLPGVTLGVTAATNTMQEIAERGGSGEQVLFGGIMAGIFECLFEDVSISQIEKMQEKEAIRGVKDILKNFAKSIGTNFTEEAATELANIVTDAFAMGTVSVAAERMQELADQGYTDSEAKKIIAKELTMQIFGAGISGAVMGAGFTVLSIPRGIKVGKAVAEAYASYVDTARIIPESMRPAQPDLNTLDVDGVQEYGRKVYDALSDYLATPEGKELVSQMQKTMETLGLVTSKTITTASDLSRAIEDGKTTAQEDISRIETAEITAEDRRAAREEMAREAAQTGAESDSEAREYTDTAGERTNVPAASERLAEADELRDEELDAVARQILTEYNESGASSEDIRAELERAVRQLRESGDERSEYIADRLEESFESQDMAAAPEGEVYEQKQNAGQNTESVAETAAGTAAESAAESGRGSTVSDGQERIYDARTEVETAAVGGGAEQRADAGGEAAQSGNGGQNLQQILRQNGVKAETTRSLGISSGTDTADLYRIPASLYSQYTGANLSRIENSLKAAGAKNVVFVSGLLSYTGADNKIHRADGAHLADGTVIVSVDSPWGAERIARHELFHAMFHGQPQVIQRMVERLKSKYGEAQIKSMLAAYTEKYGAIYGNDETRIFEEFLADAYAGINRFSTDEGSFKNVRSEVRQAASERSASTLNMPATPENLATSLEEGDIEQAAMFSYSSLAEAAGFKGVEEDGERYFVDSSNAKVKEVTAEDIHNSPIGMMISFAKGEGFLGNTVEENEAAAKQQEQFFADVCTLAIKNRDFGMSMNFAGAVTFTAIKANADNQYKSTYDFKSICVKTQAVIDAMSKAMVAKEGALTKAEILDVYREVSLNGLPVPCPECYVFARWIGIGGLLDNMWKYQQRYGKMSVESVIDAYDQMRDKVSAKAEESGLTFGKAKTKLSEQITKEYNKLREKIDLADSQGVAVKDSDRERLNVLSSLMSDVKALTWIEKVYFGGKAMTEENKNENFAVPAEVLFDLNRGAEFSARFKEAWAFRTTQGAGYGKAITPFAEAVLGEGILGTANLSKTIKDKATHKLNNPFLTSGGQLTKAAENTLRKAMAKQKTQRFRGGQRFSSTSDMSSDIASDLLISMLEMQTMNAAVQMYTKVDGAVGALARMNAFVNQSLMPLGGGLKDGKLVDTAVGGMNPNVAFANRNKYDTAGTITIGVNDNHIRALFHAIQRDFVIPYHASGGDSEMVGEMRAINDPNEANVKIRSTDYTSTQNEKLKTDSLLRSEGKTEEEIDAIHKLREARIAVLTQRAADMDVVRSNTVLSRLYDKFNGGEWDGVKLTKSEIESFIYPNEYWDTTVNYENSGRNTQIYLDYCDALGIIHRFSGQRQQAIKQADGTTKTELRTVYGYDENGKRVPLTDLAYVYEGNQKTDRVEDFFWKSLIDRRMYDRNGNYQAQGPISLNSLTETDITEFAKNNVGKAYNEERSAEVAERMTQRFAETMFSEADEDTLDANVGRDIEAYIEDTGLSDEAVEEAKAIARGDMTFGEAQSEEADSIAFDQLVSAFMSAKGMGAEKILEEHGLKLDKKEQKPPETVISRYASNTLMKMLGKERFDKEMSGFDYSYLRKSEQTSLRKAVEMLNVKDMPELIQRLSDPDRAWGSSELDAAMVIQSILLHEARATGDRSKLENWTRLIRAKDTQAGQMIQANAKWSRSPAKILIAAQDMIDLIREQTGVARNEIDLIKQLDEYEAAQSELKKKRDALRAAERKLKQAQNSTEELNREAEDLQQQLDDIRGDYAAAKKALDRVRRSVEAKARRISIYEGKIDKVLDDLDNARLDKLRQELTKRIQELDTVGSQVMDNVNKQVEALLAVEDGDRNKLVDVIMQNANIRKNKVANWTVNFLRTDPSIDFDYLYKMASAQIENIALDFVKSSFGEKLSTYQTMSHLLNARTALRNIVSNQTFEVINTIANDTAVIPDIMLSLFTKRRGVNAEFAWLSGAHNKASVEGAKRSAAEIMLDVEVGENKSKYDTGGRRTWSMASSNAAGRMMSRAERTMGYLLNTTDEYLKNGIRAETRRSLQPFVDKGYMSEERADWEAERAALYGSFQDPNNVSLFLLSMKKALNNLAGLKGREGNAVFGLGDFIQKYTQVPGALISRAIEFSPLGYAKAVYNMFNMGASGTYSVRDNNGQKTLKLTGTEKSVYAQRQAALAIGRASTGTGLIALFTLLAKVGVLRRKEDEENKDVAALDAAEGVSGTQVNMTALRRLIDGESTKWKKGDILVDFDFLEPINALLAIGTEVARSGGMNLKNLKDASLSAMFDAILETPTLQTIKTIFDELSYHDSEKDKYGAFASTAIEIVQSSITGFIPSVVRQLAQATDDTYRDQYTSNDALGIVWDKIRNSIPKLRKELPAKLDNFGEEKKYGNAFLNALNALVAPGGIYVYQRGEISEELARLREATGEDNFYPSRYAPYSLSGEDTDGNKAKVDLTGEQRQEYQKNRGTVTSMLMAELMASESYARATDEERAQMLTAVKNIANDIARTGMLESLDMTNPNNDYNKYYFLTSSGVPSSLALEYMLHGKDIESMANKGAFKDENGETVPNAKAMAYLDMIRGYSVPDDAKTAMLYTVSDTNADKIQNILDATTMTFDEVADIWQQYVEIGRSEDKANIKATDFAMYVDGLGLPGDTRDLVLETWQYSTGFKTQAERYEKYHDAGISAEDAGALTKAISNIPVEDGKNATNAQIVGAIVGTGLNDKTTVKAIAASMQENSLYTRLMDSDTLTDAEKVKAAQAVSQIPANEDGSDIKDWQRQMAAVKAISDPEKQIEAYALLGGTDSYNRNKSVLTVAAAYDITPEVFLNFKYNVLPNFNANGNTSYDQDEKTAAVNSMEGLTRQQKAALYQLIDTNANVSNKTGKITDKSPYDRDVAAAVHNAAQQGKEEDAKAKEAKKNKTE